MNRDWDDYLVGDQIRKYKRGAPRGKLNALLTELIEKEEEIIVYKNRLKELEAAFYYNLELISERDLELGVLEKQLGSENDQFQELIRERNELEDLIKLISDKNNKKIKQLETKLSLKGEELRDIQRENINKVNTLERVIDDIKHQQEKKISKLSTKFEMQKEEIIKGYQEEMEEKEKYYLLEIDNLAGKLAQICLEKEELIKADEENKNHFENLKRHFIEKENHYLQEITKSNPTDRKVNREVQCNFKPQVSEKKIQVQPYITTTDSQTSEQDNDSLQDYIQKISFLQEQNEVLKYIVKDLKRNRDVESEPKELDQPPGCECLQIRTEIDQVNKKFESEINNLKKILEEEQKLRTEEDVVIQSLETSMTFLKDKLVLGLQEKLYDLKGNDIDACTYNHEIQNEVKVALLEQKLSTKMDSFMAAAGEENKKVHKKIEELKTECLDKIEKYLRPRKETEFKSENLLEKIRMEIQKLENKIESDMRNLVRNNSKTNKCDKNFEARVEFPESKRVITRRTSAVFPDVPITGKCLDYSLGSEFGDVINWRGVYLRNDLSREKHVSFNKCGREANFRNQFKKRLGEQKVFGKVFNNLVLGR